MGLHTRSAMRKHGVLTLFAGSVCILVAILALVFFALYSTTLYKSIPQPLDGARALPPMNTTQSIVDVSIPWNSTATMLLFSIDTSAVNPTASGEVTEQAATIDINMGQSFSVRAQTAIQPGSNADYPPKNADSVEDKVEIILPLCTEPS